MLKTKPSQRKNLAVTFETEVNLVGKRKVLQILKRHFLFVFEPGPSICDVIKFSETWCAIEQGLSPLLLGWVCPCEKCNMRHQNDERYRLQGKEKELNSSLCFQSTWYQDKLFHRHHRLGPLRARQRREIQCSTLSLQMQAHRWTGSMVYPVPGTTLLDCS